MSIPQLLPQWPAPPGVHALCTTRGATAADGASRGAFGYFNLGTHVGDAPAAVASNRHALTEAIGVPPCFVHQVHGTRVVAARTPNGAALVAEADGVVTRQEGVACAILVADCLPILLAERAGRCVAALHAGWRGLAAGVVERTLEALRALDTAAPTPRQDDVMAWLGPCIGLSCFEVGEDVYAAFMQHDTGAQACFVPQGHGKHLADLAALARQRLRAAGVTAIYGNDGTPAWCTVTDERLFYSYRRANRCGVPAGRMAACIWLAKNSAPGPGA